MAAHGRPRAADDAQAHAHDENRIENGTAYRADEHGKKRPVRRAAGTDEIIDAHTDDLEDAAQADDLNEIAGIGAHRIGGRRKREQRFDAGRHMSEHREQNGYQHAECEGIAQNMLGFAVLPLAQTKRAQRVAACADEHRNRHEHRHDRRCHAYGGKTDFSCTVAKEYRVDNVVRTVHEHAQNRRHREFDYEGRNIARAHARDALVFLLVGRLGFSLARFAHHLFFSHTRPSCDYSFVLF